MRKVVTSGGESLSLDVVLSSMTASRASAPDQSTADIDRERSNSNADNPQGILAPADDGRAAEVGGSSALVPWIVTSSGAAVAVAGGVLLAVALSNKAQVENPAFPGADGVEPSVVVVDRAHGRSPGAPRHRPPPLPATIRAGPAAGKAGLPGGPERGPPPTLVPPNRTLSQLPLGTAWKPSCPRMHYVMFCVRGPGARVAFELAPVQ